MSMILDLEELRNICALGLPVYLADPTREKVIIYDDPCITVGLKGKFLESSNGSSVYLSWLIIPDPTFTSTRYSDDLRIFEGLTEAAEYVTKIIEQRRSICS